MWCLRVTSVPWSMTLRLLTHVALTPGVGPRRWTGQHQLPGHEEIRACAEACWSHPVAPGRARAIDMPICIAHPRTHT